MSLPVSGMMPYRVDAEGFGLLYSYLLLEIMRRGHEETNARTGKRVRIYSGGPVSFAIDLSDGLLPITKTRKLFPGTAAAETAWYLMGTQDATFMLKHAKVVWEKFVEEIDVTRDALGYNPLNEASALYVRGDKNGVFMKGVKAAYGYRWRSHFGRDQIEDAIAALQENSTNRRIYVSAWDPMEDGLLKKNQLNVPCPVGFTLSIVDGKLTSAYMLRSSDVFVGLPYDVMGHALLMSAIAKTLDVPLGTMHFTLAHPHVYDVHFEMADRCLDNSLDGSCPMLPNWSVEQIEKDPDGYVSFVKELAGRVKWSGYCPRPEVVQ